jgi:LAO/AO transport system kinase
MEIAQVFAINKSDLPGADRLRREVHAALSLSPGEQPEIVDTVAVEGKGVPEVLAAARRRLSRDPERAGQIWAQRLREMLRERLLERFPEPDFLAAGREIAAKRRDPYTILDEWTRHGV